MTILCLVAVYRLVLRPKRDGVCNPVAYVLCVHHACLTTKRYGRDYTPSGCKPCTYAGNARERAYSGLRCVTSDPKNQIFSDIQTLAALKRLTPCQSLSKLTEKNEHAILRGRDEFTLV